MKLIAMAALSAFALSQIAAAQAVQWRLEDGGNGHWYQRRPLAPSDLSFTAARNAAESAGGTLASIHSEAENEFVRILNGGAASYWIGGVQVDPSCSGTGCAWRWISSEPWIFERWCCGGDNDVGGEDCLACSENGLWNSVPCIGGPGMANFIVEWSADCNNDGVVDYGQILDGTLVDANSDGIPDVCVTLRVPEEYPTIQAAVDAAPSLSTVLVAPGSYAPFDFQGKPITVKSTHGAASTTIHASGLSTSAVTFGAGSTMRTMLQGFTVQPGAGSIFNAAYPALLAGGGCFLLNGSGQIADCRFVGGAGGCGYGGGVWAADGSVAIRRCSFDSIGVAHYGGAISVQPGVSTETVPGEVDGTRVLIEDCVIRNCSSFNVGGIDVRLFKPDYTDNIDGVVIIRRADFEGNSASVHGRDVLAAGVNGKDPSAVVRVQDCVFRSTGTVVKMGYYDGAGGGNMEVDSCVFAAPGGAICRTNGRLSLSNSWFCDGTISVDGTWIDLGGNSATCPPSLDCNGNGVEDFYEIVLGQLADGDGDFIADDCNFVSVPSDYPTIQAAIDTTPAGEARTIVVAPGTYNQSFALNGRNVIVRGASNNTTILDGAGLSGSIARFTGGEPATAGIESLVFRNGTAGSLIYPGASFDVGGAIYGANSSAFIRNCRFESCSADFGGAVYLISSRSAIENCVFDRNTGINEGGGLFLYETTSRVAGCAFTANDVSVKGPGAGSAFKAVGARASGEAVELANCTVTGNRGLLTASAIEYYENIQSNPGVLRISGCTVTGNISGLGLPDGAAGLRVLGRSASCIISGGTTICSNAPTNTSGPFLIEGSANVCGCFADLTGDGLVNGGDLGALLGAWGIAGPTGVGDANHDGLVDAADLSEVLSSWGNCPN